MGKEYRVGGRGCAGGSEDTLSMQEELEIFAIEAIKAMDLGVIKTSLFLRIMMHCRMLLMMNVKIRHKGPGRAL